MSGSSCVSYNIGAVRLPGCWVTPKNLYFRGFGTQKTISSYSFDRIVMIFGYIVERTNTKFSRAIFCNFHLEPKL